MKRIATIEEGYIVNISLANDDYILKENEMLESDAMNSYERKPVPVDHLKENVDKGFCVKPENFRLALWEEDQNKFTRLLTLLQEGRELGVLEEDTIISIKDMDGQVHDLSSSRFRQIMVEYGFYFKSIWDAYS